MKAGDQSAAPNLSRISSAATRTESAPDRSVARPTPDGSKGPTLWRAERATIDHTGSDSQMPIANLPGHEAGTGEASARSQSEQDIGGPRPASNETKGGTPVQTGFR